MYVWGRSGLCKQTKHSFVLRLRIIIEISKKKTDIIKKWILLNSKFSSYLSQFVGSLRDNEVSKVNPRRIGAIKNTYKPDLFATKIKFCKNLRSWSVIVKVVKPSSFRRSSRRGCDLVVWSEDIALYIRALSCQQNWKEPGVKLSSSPRSIVRHLWCRFLASPSIGSTVDNFCWPSSWQLKQVSPINSSELMGVPHVYKNVYCKYRQEGTFNTVLMVEKYLLLFDTDKVLKQSMYQFWKLKVLELAITV